jgi:hypothetical protein
MNRRRFLAATGSLAATGAAIIGSGAFTTAEVNRDVEVTVTTDKSGYLSLFPNPNYDGAGGAESPFAVTKSGPGELKLAFGSSGNGGTGVAPNSTYFFEQRIFNIVNQGTTDVGVTIDQIDQPDPDNDGNSSDDFFFTLTALGFDLQYATGAAPIGQTVGPGAYISTGDIDANQTLSFEVTLVAENPANWIEENNIDEFAVKPEGEPSTTQHEGPYGP